MFSYITIKLKIAELPRSIQWSHIFGASILGGIGFTMSLFISNLAFDNVVLINQSKLGILIGSIVAAVFGFVNLKIILRKASPVNN